MRLYILCVIMGFILDFCAEDPGTTIPSADVFFENRHSQNVFVFTWVEEHGEDKYSLWIQYLDKTSLNIKSGEVKRISHIPYDDDGEKVHLRVYKQSTIDEFGWERIKEEGIHDCQYDISCADINEDGIVHIVYPGEEGHYD